MGQEEAEDTEFLQGEYLSEAETTKKLWFEIKFQICKHCIPSCHIKTATRDFNQVKFLNALWDGCQKGLEWFECQAKPNIQNKQNRNTEA